MKKILLVLVLISLFLAPTINAQLQAISKTIEISPTELIETKTCPVDCTCTGDAITCPVETSCMPPCVKSGDTCTCPVEPPTTCSACVGGIPTSQKDSNGCPIYSCPTKNCPAGCTCSGDTTTCPTPPISCPIPICANNAKPLDTGKSDLNGCKIYSCPQQVCPAITCSISDCPNGCEIDTAGCLTGKCKVAQNICPTIACAINECELDSSGCWTYKRKSINCPAISCAVNECEVDASGCLTYKNKSKTCPDNCICEGNVITCPTIEIRPTTATVETLTGTGTIQVKKIGDKLQIESGKTSATSKETFVIEESKLYAKTSSGNKQIKVLPEVASSKATTVTNVNTIELKEESQQLIYSVMGTKQTKLLFVIPVSMQIETKVSAESGNVISVNKPWWSFLAW